MRNQLQG